MLIAIFIYLLGGVLAVYCYIKACQLEDNSDYDVTVDELGTLMGVFIFSWLALVICSIRIIGIYIENNGHKKLFTVKKKKSE